MVSPDDTACRFSFPDEGRPRCRAHGTPTRAPNSQQPGPICAPILWWWPHVRSVVWEFPDSRPLAVRMAAEAKQVLGQLRPQVDTARRSHDSAVVRASMWHWSLDVRVAAIDNPLCPSTEAMLMLRNLDPHSRALVAGMSKSVAVLRWLVEQSSGGPVAMRAISNPAYPLATVKALVTQGHLWAKLSMACRPDCAPQDLQSLAVLRGTSRIHQMIREQAMRTLRSQDKNDTHSAAIAPLPPPESFVF